MSRPYYIYHLVDPRDGIPRYVGCTMNPGSRVQWHLNSSKNEGLKAWLAAMRKEFAISQIIQPVSVCESSAGSCYAEVEAIADVIEKHGRECLFNVNVSGAERLITNRKFRAMREEGLTANAEASQ